MSHLTADAAFASLFDAARPLTALAPGGISVQDADCVRLLPAVFEIRDAWAIPSDWTFLTPDNRLIVEGTAVNPYFVRKGISPHVSVTTDGRCRIDLEAWDESIPEALFVGGDCSNNYYHWVIDHLPRLVVWKHHLRSLLPGPRPPIALIADPPRFVAEMLRAVGIVRSDVRLIDRTRAHRFGRLLVLSNFSQYGAVHPVAHRILGALRVPPDPSRPDRILVSRRDAGTRRLLNEDALADRLAPLGFTTVVPGAMSFDEQRATFASAHLVVAPHGAALANMVFAPHGAHLIELKPHTSKALTHFRMLTEGLGQRHEMITAERNGTTMPDHPNSDYRIAPDRVLAAVRAWEERRGTA